MVTDPTVRRVRGGLTLPPGWQKPSSWAEADTWRYDRGQEQAGRPPLSQEEPPSPLPSACPHLALFALHWSWKLPSMSHHPHLMN